MKRLLSVAALDQREDWRQACTALRGAEARWAIAPTSERGRTYNECLLALEREEEAARIYRDLLAELMRRT